MKYPKKGFNRMLKKSAPGQTDGEIVLPKKAPLPVQPKLGKPASSGWKHRWFLPLAIMTLVVGLGLGTGPVLAQDASNSGPVQFPASASTATNAPAVSPVQATPTATPTPALSNTPSANTATEAGDIHDIRGPISIPYQWLWVIYVAASLLAAAALYGLWRLLRRRAKIAAKLPYEIALEKLEAARALMTAETVREYAFTVSEVIRVYIEQRFGEKAARRTTEEFLSDLLQQTGTPLAQHRRRLEDFLEHCDLMKFARWSASVREMESMLESARVFVLETWPQPEPAKTSVAPAQPELAPNP